MNKIFNVLVDLQSVFAILLAAALIMGAFAKEHQDTDLKSNVAFNGFKDTAGTTACDRLLPDDLQACAPTALPSDPVALWSMAPR